MTTPQQITSRLEARFPTADLEWRAIRAGTSNGKPWVQIVPYVSARAVCQRLDEVLGLDGWEITYRRQEIASAEGTPIDGLVAVLRVRVGDRWVTREDGAAVGAVGSPEAAEMAYKGVMSSAIKRVAVTVGIGRYLYSQPTTFGTIVEKGGTKQRVSSRGQPDQWVRWVAPVDVLQRLAPEDEVDRASPVLEAIDAPDGPPAQPQAIRAAEALHKDQMQHAPTSDAAGIPDRCPSCGGPVTDCRESKASPRSPDWRCRNQDCRDAKGFVTAGWMDRGSASAAPAATAKGRNTSFDDLPEALEEDGDDLPF